MANELRFLDGDLLFDGGSLAMNADCCCEGTAPTCSEWNNTTVRSGIEFGYEVGGITINPFFGCSCSGVPLSGIATYNGCVSGANDWCRRYTLNCNGLCVFFGVRLGCSGGLVTINADLSSTACSNGTIGGTFDWNINFRRIIAETSFLPNTSYDMPWLFSFVSASSRCQPAGHASATLTLSYTT